MGDVVDVKLGHNGEGVGAGCLCGKISCYEVTV